MVKYYMVAIYVQSCMVAMFYSTPITPYNALSILYRFLVTSKIKKNKHKPLTCNTHAEIAPTYRFVHARNFISITKCSIDDKHADCRSTVHKLLQVLYTL